MGELVAPVPFQWAGGRQSLIWLEFWRSLLSPEFIYLLFILGADLWLWFLIFP